MHFYLTTSASTFPCFQINWLTVSQEIDNFGERLFIPNSHFKITHMPSYYYISLRQRNGEQK